MRPTELLHSTTFHQALLYTALFAGSALLLLGFIYWSTVAYMSDQTDATIEADIQGLKEQYRERGLEGLVQTINARLERDPDISSVYLLTTSGFVPLAGNLSAWPEADPDDDRWLSFEFKDPRAGERMFQARARPFILEGGLRLLVGRDTRELRATQQLIVRALLWGMAITLVLAAAVGIVMSRSSLRRLEQINQTSREIVGGDLARRVPTDGSGDDLDQLACNLNTMLDEIQRLMHGIRHVSDNVAHDLRTPLTRLRNRLEGVLGGLDVDSAQRAEVEDGLAEVDRLLATFAALLRITRIEAGSRTARFAPVDLADLLNDARELYEAVAESQGLEFSLQLEETSPVMGDRDLLFQAVINLIDNAIKYTPREGRVVLGLVREERDVVLSVTDTGPGVPVEERERVLQRFYRLERSRSTPGSGLGLSLVAAVAQLHKAGFTLEEARPGLSARLRFVSRPPTQASP